MRARFSPIAYGALSLPLLLACGSLRAEPAQPAIHDAYVLLAESPAGSTVAFARVIIDPGQSCPALVPVRSGSR